MLVVVLCVAVSVSAMEGVIAYSVRAGLTRLTRGSALEWDGERLLSESGLGSKAWRGQELLLERQPPER